jgi:hypothetical protein
MDRGPYEMYTQEELTFQERYAFAQLLRNGGLLWSSAIRWVVGLYGRSEIRDGSCRLALSARGSSPPGNRQPVLAMAEEEARRRGCARITLTTLSVEAPGF